MSVPPLGLSAVTVKVSEVPAGVTVGDAGDAQEIGRAGGRLPDGLGERVGGLAVDAVAVLVHVVAVPVLDVGADCQGVGAGGGLGGERDRELVVVRAGDRGDGHLADRDAPPGPVKVTCDAVKVAGLISSLKVSCTVDRPPAAVDRAVGRGGDDVGAVGVGDGGARVHDAAGGHLARQCRVGGGGVEDRVDDLAHRPGRVGGLHQCDRAGDQGRGHRGAAVVAVGAVR